MTVAIDHSTLHRTAKFFMDSGRAASHEEALALLQSFGLSVVVSAEAARTRDGQVALLTLVNLARRTLLAGIEVAGIGSEQLLAPLADADTLAEAVRELGGRVTAQPRAGWPCAVIGDASVGALTLPSWRLTWEGWRGGVVPLRDRWRLAEKNAMALAPAVAAAACAAEAFFFHAGDHPMAGKRAAGLSLWEPGSDWATANPDEPALAFLPARLWLIGLGNLGQAYAWLLACLPYDDPAEVDLMLQDFDRIAESNDSTSLLTSSKAIGWMKTRWVTRWLERRGFAIFLEERRFGEWTQRHASEPGAALCGVDNALARSALEQAGFDLIIESGLGAGPQCFRNFSMHSFPGPRQAAQIWPSTEDAVGPDVSDQPAYSDLREKGMDACGLAQLASRTVGVPFVGLFAGAFVIGELMRRLHGGQALAVVSGSTATLADLESWPLTGEPYSFGHVQVRREQ